MKERKKKKDESKNVVAVETHNDDNSSEIIIDATKMSFLNSDQEIEDDKSPKWEVQIADMNPMESCGVKFSLFTPGESSSGQIVVDFVSKSGVNSGLFGWLQNPSEKKVKITIDDHEKNRIEQWEMLGQPVAIAIDELNIEAKHSWFTTLQMSVKNIKIT